MHIQPYSKNAKKIICTYDKTVFDRIRQLKPSSRGELEITDVNNSYIKDNQLTANYITGYWQDAGTPEGLYKSSTLIREKVI